MSIIRFDGVCYEYSEGELALDGVDLSIVRGEFVAIIGHNGSGKSTMAKHMNALYVPKEGSVHIMDMDSSEEENILAIRAHAGMVFQNPDNQMVTTIVEEDVAFGPENLGIPSDEIRKRVDEALVAVNMTKFAQFAPHNLSGGQKQRIAIAGILAMEPDIIILDEATAMLDPMGREEVLETIQKLNKENGITVILITHFMEEAALADRIVIISRGKISMQGKPDEVFARVDELDVLGLDVPFSVRLATMLRAGGLPVANQVADEALADEIARMITDQG